MGDYAEFVALKLQICCFYNVWLLNVILRLCHFRVSNVHIDYKSGFNTGQEPGKLTGCENISLASLIFQQKVFKKEVHFK